MSFALLATVTSEASVLPASWMVLPFVVLLLCIALMPLVASRFWEHHYPKVAVGLGLITAAYYFFALHHPAAVMHAMTEYVSFMALVGSLFVISGGINIRVKGGATPGINVTFLLAGAIIANIIGTTGASMLLIRPWIRMNKYRITSYHVVFFIFIVSNVGGALTPVGDPPLFLGFLRGIPFWWIIQHVWLAWALAVGLLLLVFYLLDAGNFKRAPREIAERETRDEIWMFRGLHNLLLLGVVLAAVFLPQTWRINLASFSISVSSLVMVAAAVTSYFTTPLPIHEANDFNFAPVKEVGVLFVGIFLTMIPALGLLSSGHDLHLTSPIQFYFASGSLSAFLDNAPTYLAFLAAAMGGHHLDINTPADVLLFLEKEPFYVIAISLGAVFFGAGSYIGNGPNFMVKAIADKAKVNTPSFLDYIFRFSLPILIPILVFVGWLLLGRGH